MPGDDFHNKAFDEGTLTKLQLFELYAREWLPVFLASPTKREVHLFDFFSGPGKDLRGEFGSPLRLLRQLNSFTHLPGWSKVSMHVHFFDASSSKIAQLRTTIDQLGLCAAGVTLDVQVLEYYRGLLPDPAAFYLAPFSIKKGANIYGVIFGSAHPLGMDKFLQVAWKKDEINGEADFDIGRESVRPGELVLPLDDFRPTKVKAFERELEQQLRAGKLRNEADVVHLCFDHGVKRQHAEPVLKKLKKEGVIALDFRVPQADRLQAPRPIRLLRSG